MKSGIVVLLSVMWTLSMSGCHFFEDSENVDECALNSGYPCPCIPDVAVYKCKDGSDEPCCEDGYSRCVYTTINEERGICTNPCDGKEDSSACINTNGFGSEGICAMQVNESDEANFCEVVCDPGSDDCPPGMECRDDLHAPEFSVCRPESPL